MAKPRGRKASRLLAVLCVIGLVLVIAFAWLVSSIRVDVDKAAEWCRGNSASTASTPADPPVIRSDNTIVDTVLEQRQNANLIVKIGRERKQPENDIVLAIMVAKQESNLKNVTHGDRDSLGLFQQRPSQGWGSPEEVTTPEYAINAFYDALDGIGEWSSYLDAALAVQRPSREAYLSEVNYFPGWESLAKELLATSTAVNPALPELGTTAYSFKPSSEICDKILAAQTQSRTALDIVMQAARRYVGQDPNSTVASGAELVKMAYGKAGVILPGTADKLALLKDDESAGIKTTWHTAAEITSGAFTPKPGDIVCYSSVADPTREDCEMAGLYETASSSINGFTIVTYNARGASHTDRGRTRELHSSVRIEKMVRVLNDPDYPMDVIGLQEFEARQRQKFLQETKGTFDIYPKTAVYTSKGGRTSVNSITWRKSRFDLVSGDTREFVYFNGNENQIPIVKLRDRTTGGEFYVYNTHDPANVKGPAGAARIEDARRHVSTLRDLKQEGIPAFALGDYNSKIYEQPHKIMMASGLVRDAYEAAGARGKRAKIDRIYATPDARLSDYRVVSTKDAQLSTDHLPVGVRAEVGSPGKTSPVKDSELGNYIGFNTTTGKFDRLPMTKTNLVGVLRLTLSQPETVVASGKWQLPVQHFTLTAMFGECGSNWENCHTGLDFAAPTGTDVGAVIGGEITEAGDAGAYGNRIIVSLPDGTEIWYCHLNEFVLTSGPVTAGTLIGKVGSTGNTTGPHLHLEVRLPDGTPVDPMVVLKRHGADPNPSGA